MVSLGNRLQSSIGRLGHCSMDKARLVATLATPLSLRGEELEAARGLVQWVEVRADLIDEPDPAWLRNHFDGKLIYSLRTTDAGGQFAGPDSERRRLLLRAAKSYDAIELESPRDLTRDILAAIATQMRLISWYGAADDSDTLLTQFKRLAGIQAHLYKLVTLPTRIGGELAPLAMLKSLGRNDTVAFAAGPSGFWTRLMAPYLGAPVVFGRLGDQGAPDDPTIKQLVEDYGLPNLTALEKLYGIVGNPIHHSLSPRLHNAAYRSLGCSALFLPFQAQSFSDFWREVVLSPAMAGLGVTIKGLTVASPHKEAALSAAAVSSPMVKRAGSTNLFVRNGKGWKAETTDPEGVVLALRSRGLSIKGKRTAVVGCGGAGRAVAAALDQAGARVTLVNRGLERAIRATRLLGLPFVRLSDFATAGYSIVVNATPVGRDDGQVPFDIEDLSKNAVVVDLTYGVKTTPLVAGAFASGRTAIDGKEVLLIQAQRQFRIMTNQEMPPGLARDTLGWTGCEPGNVAEG